MEFNGKTQGWQAGRQEDCKITREGRGARNERRMLTYEMPEGQQHRSSKFGITFSLVSSQASITISLLFLIIPRPLPPPRGTIILPGKRILISSCVPNAQNGGKKAGEETGRWMRGWLFHSRSAWVPDIYFHHPLDKE